MPLILYHNLLLVVMTFYNFILIFIIVRFYFLIRLVIAISHLLYSHIYTIRRYNLVNLKRENYIYSCILLIFFMTLIIFIFLFINYRRQHLMMNLYYQIVPLLIGFVLIFELMILMESQRN